ncbi:MAG: EpsG family protein [Oscillospiraceae bacterium]|nr:EpsG family protein [Oscillospiraceae bacterium]
MLIYYILLALACAGMPLCGKKCGKWGKIVYCAVFAVLITVVSAIRFQVGYDFGSYGGTYANMFFRDVDDLSMIKMEKGFLMPMYFFSLGFESYWTVFVYTSIAIYLPIFVLIYFNSSKPWISVCAFLCFGIFFNSLCFLRQIMAAVILAYAIKYVCGKSYLRFMIFVIAASAFHWSALAMAVLYFFLRIKPSLIYLGVVSVGTILFCIFSRSAMLFLTEKFYMYSVYNPDTSGEAMVGLPPRYTIMFGVLFIVCFLFRKKLIEKNPNNGIYINCLMFTTVFEAMGMRHAILSRFAILTYLPAILYLLPDAAEVTVDYAREKKGRLGGILSAAAAAVYSVVFYTILMINNYNGVVPYTTQFNRPYDIFVEMKTTEEDAEDFEDEEDYDEEDEDFEDDENEEEGGVIIDTLPEFQ